MAKINRVTRQNNFWQVEITADDPECKWNINPKSVYYKIIKATNINAAVRGAATYCNKQMAAFPGVFFTYSTQNVKPYFPRMYSCEEERDERPTTSKI
jgi:hypothetical protein